MSSITIQDLSEMTTLDTQTMSDTRGGRHVYPKLKIKPWRPHHVRPVQRNTINFGSGNSFVGNTAGVNNGSMTINGGIHL